MADIELVIKIPEIEYEHITNKEKFYSLEKSKKEWLINKILNYVMDGTPLPKGHWRPIYQGDEIIDYRCSKCEFGNTFGKSTHGMNYCPNCGADMREVEG